MPAALLPETFRFLRQLERNNHKAWMDENRERCQEHVMAPLRGLVGFRNHGGSNSPLASLGRVRALDNPEWLARQARRLGRRAYAPAAATRPAFTAQVRKVFRELFPLYAFTALEG